MADGDTKTFKIKKTADPYDEWGPEFTQQKKIKRTGCGFPYSFPIIQDYSGCEALDYVFRLDPMYEPLLVDDYQEITVTGGVGPYMWTVGGDYFSFVDEETEEGSNIVYSDLEFGGPADAVITVTDACENERTGVIHWCDDTAKGTVEGNGKGPPPSQQDKWERVADFGTNERRGAVAAATESGLIYAGIGYDPDRYPTHLVDWWEYDSLADSWTQKANFPGVGYLGRWGRYEAVAAAIGNKVYVGTGFDGYDYFYDWWEYDADNNSWEQKHNFENARAYALGIACLGYVFVGTGREPYPYTKKYKDWFAYSPEINNWIEIESMSKERYAAIGTSYDDKLYVGGGSDGVQSFQDWWEYNPVTENWTQKANLPCVLNSGVAVACKGRIYVGTWGGDNGIWYAYNPLDNSWTDCAIFDGIKRSRPIAASVYRRVFFGTGYGTDGLEKLSWWKYTP